MITFESIKEKYEHLTDAQKELLSHVSAFVLSDNLDAYIDRLDSYVKAIKHYNEDADNDALISYLKYARDYEFPNVYYLQHNASDYDGRIINLNAFYSVSLFDYIDNKYAIQILNRDFIDYVIDPVHNSAPDLSQYNDQYFKDEAEAFIKEHNESIK